MRIKSIHLTNHQILSNLSLNFTNDQNEPIETIILAGENGTGKTSILNLIYEFSNFRLEDRQRDEQRLFEIKFSEQEIETILKGPYADGNFRNGIGDHCFKFLYDFNITGNWNQVKVEYLDKDKETRTITGSFFSQTEVKPVLRSLFSDVEVNYTPRAIQHVTAKNLDETSGNNFKSGGDLATEITQLLIDIQALDSQDFSQWAKMNINKPIDESQIDVRMKRFTKAFDLIFPKKKFHGVFNEAGHKVVKFQENGKTMAISQLSSGEKQIVFRGGFLIRDRESRKGATVLIDEPEISLHPKWQIEILDFYKALFYDEESQLSSQLIISTHSPFIIHNPNRNNDKVIILTKDHDGSIRTLQDPSFYSWTKKRIVKEAFNIDYDIKNNKGKLFLEGPTDEQYFRKAKDLFQLNDLKFDISWIGRIANGGNEFTGDTALNHARSFFLANSDLLTAKIILCYDNDTRKPEETHDELCIRVMPKNDDNNLFKIGIENLLVLPQDFNPEEFYDEKEKTDEYGAKTKIQKLNKMELCNWVCNECNPDQQKEILDNIRKYLIKLNN